MPGPQTYGFLSVHGWWLYCGEKEFNKGSPHHGVKKEAVDRLERSLYIEIICLYMSILMDEFQRPTRKSMEEKP